MIKFRRVKLNAIGAIGCLLLLVSCANYQPMQTVDYVDLKRFMGDWYVIANIPTFIEEGAHNAVESYQLEEDGSIATTFTFRDGASDGEMKIYTPRGFIQDKRTNAVWDMQFIWPFKADYRVVYLSEDYKHTIIGRNKRDYVWIMARTPTVEEADYQSMLKVVEELGYDVRKVQRVPQRW